MSPWRQAPGDRALEIGVIRGVGELADDLGGLVGYLGGLVSGLRGQSESHWHYPSPFGTFRSLIPFDQTFNLCTIANGQTSAVPEARQRSRGPVNGLGARQRSWERSSTVWELVSGPGSVRQRSWELVSGPGR